MRKLLLGMLITFLMPVACATGAVPAIIKADSTVMDSSCEITDEHEFTCSKGGDSYTAEIPSKRGHDYQEIVANKATPEQDGQIITRHCSGCGYSTDAKRTVKKATPFQNGSVTVVCTECGEIADDKDVSYTIYSPKSIVFALPENIDGDIFWNSIEAATYTGKAIEPRVYVKDTDGEYIEKAEYIVTYQNNKKVGEALATVEFKDEYYTGKLVETLPIIPQKPIITILTSTGKYDDPLNKGGFCYTVRAVGNGFELSWKKQTKQITGYQLQYSRKKNFKNAKNVWVKNNKASSKKVANLKEYAKYFVRIRSYKTVNINGKNKKFYSEWVNVEVTTTKKIAKAWVKPTKIPQGKFPYRMNYIYNDGGKNIYFYYTKKNGKLPKNMSRMQGKMADIYFAQRRFGEGKNGVMTGWTLVGTYNGVEVWRRYLVET